MICLRHLSVMLGLLVGAAPALRATPEHLHQHPSGIQVRVLAAGVGPGAPLPELAVMGEEGKPAALEFLRYNISLPVNQKKGDSTVRVFLKADLEKAQITGTNGEAAPPVPVLEYVLPPKSERCLVVVEPATNGTGFTYKAFAEDAQDFPGGSRLVLNLTGVGLHGNMGDAKFEIPAHGSGLVKPSKAGGDDLRQNIQVFAAARGQNVPVASARWTFHPERRAIVLVFTMDAQLTSFRLLAIPDAVPAGSLSAR